ncbi:MAG TPA: SBBP repeat-containing protein [Parafilimonas sp.]|nr:SBBP repeat-containing protein [Parafilimonas sp.]
MMKNTFLLLLALFFMFSANTQTILWTKNFNGSANANDAITAMATDANGSVYVTGFADNGARGTDYVTIKYNTNGTRVWRATYDGPGKGNDAAKAIAVDNAGNVYVTGKSDDLPDAFVDDDAATIKYNSDGKLMWVSRYHGKAERGDEGRAIKVDQSGYVYIAGYTSERSGAHSDFNYLTVKYSPTGNQEWKAIYAGTTEAPNDQNDSANAISVDAKGNVYVTGMSNGAGGLENLNQDFLTIKYNALGVQQWTARYNGPGDQIDEAFALMTDVHGNAFVTGLSTGSGNKSYDFATIKYNTNGVLQWVRRHDGPAPFSEDFGFAMAMDDSENIYVTGTDHATLDNEDIYTIKYNSSGVQQWSTRYDGGDNDDPLSLTLDTNGNVYVAGYTISPQTYADGILIKYNRDGIQQWMQQFRGTQKYGWDQWTAATVDSQNNVYVAGYTTDKDSGTDYAIAKYSETSLISNVVVQAQQDSTSISVSNIPNPFSAQTRILFHIYMKGKNEADVKLWIENMRGSKLNMLVNKKLCGGEYDVLWNAENLEPGIYYCKLLCNDVLTVRKMSLIR